MNRFFRWGILIALMVMIICGVVAMRIIFMPNEDEIVPSLVGLSAIEAVGRLEALGLTAQIDQVESDQPDGTVISQNIDPGQKTARGKKILVKVSKGGSQLQIPDVRGTEFAAAVKTLDAAGFKVGTVLRVTDQLKAPGTVIAQNPAAPAMIPGSKMVDLLISEGKNDKSEMVQVPDLQGQPEDLARQILEQSDLTIARSILINSNVVPAGSIVRTQPRAGSRVPSRQAVVLYVAQIAPPSDAPGSSGDTGQADVLQVTETPVSTTAQTSERDPGDPPAQTQQQGGATQPVNIPTVSDTPTPQAVPVLAPEPSARKIAKVRYQVPPLSRPLALKIDISDQNGSRTLKGEQAKGGEYMAIDAPYAGAATVTVHLGGELVWQEKYQ